MKEQEFLEELQKEGLVCTDDISVMDFKGTDWKNMTTAQWFQFAKANKDWLDPGISWHELAALHEACELWKDKPAVILETGQCYGTTCRYFAIRNQKYGGELTSIELSHRPLFDAAMTELGLYQYMNTIRDHSQKIFWDKIINILFIDSEHALSDALGEYMKYRLFLVQDSIVGFHDSANCYGVRKAIDIIRQIDDLELISSTPLPYGAGISMFKVVTMNGAQIRNNMMYQAAEIEALRKRDAGEPVRYLADITDEIDRELNEREHERIHHDRL